MNVKRWAVLLALAAGMLWLVTGCGISQRFLAQNEPTATSTRKPRPTFTPRPTDTETPAATDTPQSTDTPPPTNTSVPPTAKPVVKVATATRRPPTAIPQPTAIPATATATRPAYPYGFVPYQNCNTTDPDICNVQNGVKCSNSGNSRLEALVYRNYSDPNSQASGVKVRFSYAPGGPPIQPDEVTGDNGLAQKTLSDQRGGNAGTYYAWIVDSSGRQLSPVSSGMKINNVPAGSPNVCIVATVVFAGGR